MPEKSDSFRITTYRRKAMILGRPANCVPSAADRLRVRCMQNVWLARAEDADENNWENGLPPVLPANSNAVATRA